MKRIAFIGRGAHTLPSHRILLNVLSVNCDVTVYSEVPIESEWNNLPHTYRLKAAVRGRLPKRFRDIIMVFTIARDHFRQRYDLIHAHSTYPAGLIAVILQKLLRLPAVVSLDAAEGSALPDIGFGDLLSRKRRLLNKWVINHASAVTTLTTFQRDAIVANLRIKRRLEVIYRGVDGNLFFPRPLGKRASPIVILSVGYINAIKDPHTLLHAFEHIGRDIDARLVVVGKDYTGGALQTLAHDLGVAAKVTFEGHVPYDRMLQYYHQADLLLHTSRYESQGMAIAEAFASGVLVVGTKVGLIHDLDGRCCIAVNHGKAEELARAVLDLLSDENAMNALRNCARKWSVENDVHRTADRLFSLYKQVDKRL